VVFLTDLVSVVELLDESGFTASPFWLSEVVVEVCDSTVVLGGFVELAGAGAADVLAGAGCSTTVGAGGVCWHPVMSARLKTAGASETRYFE